jgi:predicted neuraminidase
LNNGHLALVFNNMNADNCTERRLSLYDEIEDEEDNSVDAIVEGNIKDGKKEVVGRTAFWGAPRAPMSIAISEDGGKTWPYIKNFEVGDGYAMSNNSKDKINREYSYPSIKQSSDGKIHIAFTYFRQAIKHVCILEEWVKAL